MTRIQLTILNTLLVLGISLLGNTSARVLCFHEEGEIHSTAIESGSECCHSEAHESEAEALECTHCVDVPLEGVDFLVSREDRRLRIPIDALSRNLIDSESIDSLPSHSQPPNRPILRSSEKFLASNHWNAVAAKTVMRI